MAEQHNPGARKRPQKAKDGGLAWDPDIAQRLAINPKRLVNFQPISPDQNNKYLNSKELDCQIVCGGRGMGKSTLLLYRASYLKSLTDVISVRDVPPFGFRLAPRSIRIPRKSLSRYSAVDTWSVVWQVVLGAIFAVSIKRRSPTGLTSNQQSDWEKAFEIQSDNTLGINIVRILSKWVKSPHDECVSELVGCVLKHSYSNEQLTDFYETTIRPIFSERSSGSNIDKQWVYFVDGIDEALTDWSGYGNLLSESIALKYSEQEPERGQEKITQNAILLAQQVWKSSQAGFALATHNIREYTNVQLIAMGSMRIEAYPLFVSSSGHTDSKLSRFVLQINYTSALMKTIFDYNVDLMESDKRVPRGVNPGESQDGPNACSELCGYAVIYNRTVFGHTEDVYQMIRRHCLGTPRGLVELGGKVAEIPLTKCAVSRGKNGLWRDPTVVSAVINEKSVEVLSEYLSTLFPPWDSRYDDGLPLISNNVLFKGDIERINANFSKIHPSAQTPFVQYLYRCGLVARPSMNSYNEVRQTLRSSENDILHADTHYVLIHPALSSLVMTKLTAGQQESFFDNRIIVDDERDCTSKLLPGKLKVSRELRGNIKKIFMEWTPKKTLLTSEARLGGEVFLTVLAVSTRFYDSADLSRAQLVETAERLAKLELIPSFLGSPKVNVSQFFKSICDFTKHGESAEQSAAVTHAKSLLKNLIGEELSIKSNYEIDGNEFGFRYKNESGETRKLSGIDIAIHNLSGTEFEASSTQYSN